MKEKCGQCKWHRKENEEWTCHNPESECWGCYTGYNDHCDEFEERSSQKFSVEIMKKNHK